MSKYSNSETHMWDDSIAPQKSALTDNDINEKYARRELRIITETNREQLPNFVAALKRPDWMRLQPFYQRRRRWDAVRKSRLIESFIMNIPVPPCFVYESDLARYEVMDGQQRITTILDFYENRFALKGLEQWPELNGRIYDKLPSEIKKGLDRRSISYIALLKESAANRDEELLLRQQVFDRLNTGGVKLENQEIRHCIYHSNFDSLLIKLSRHPILRKAWGLIPYSHEEDNNPPDKLLNNPHYSKMKDVEFVLRFFALRHAERYSGGMQSFFDQYMVRSRKFSDQDVAFLEELFNSTIELASAIYGDNLFRPWNAKQNKWSKQPQIAFADTVMVGLAAFQDKRTELEQKREEVLVATKEMVSTSPPGSFTGQRNTKNDVLSRLQLYQDVLAGILA